MGCDCVIRQRAVRGRDVGSVRSGRTGHVTSVSPRFTRRASTRLRSGLASRVPPPRGPSQSGAVYLLPLCLLSFLRHASNNQYHTTGPHGRDTRVARRRRRTRQCSARRCASAPPDTE